MVRIALLGMFAVALLSLTILQLSGNAPMTCHRRRHCGGPADTYHGVKVVDPDRRPGERQRCRPSKSGAANRTNTLAIISINSRPGGAARAFDRTEQRHLAGLSRSRLPRRQAVRPQDAAAEESTVPHHADIGRRPQERADRRRSEPAQPKGTTAIDFYVPSLDGKRVAVSLSEGGSEEGTVHVYETATGKELGDVIPRVNGGTAGGSVAWNADGFRLLVHALSARQERPRKTSISISRCTSTNSARRRATIRMRWARTSRASPKFSCARRRTASTSWRSSPTAMAASSPITSLVHPVNGCN